VTTIASGFNASKPISCAQGRHGEVIIAQGGGVQPKRWTGSGSSTNAGIVAPASAPTIALNTTARYYVARADVHKPGAVYNASPAVTFSTPTPPAPAGYRAAKASAYLNQSVVSEVLVTDGGKHYPDPPSVTLSATHGAGAVLTPVMDGTLPAPDSITHYEIIQGPPFDDEADYPAYFRTRWAAWGSVEIPVANGSGTVNRTVWIYHNACGLGPGNLGSYYQVSLSLPYTVSGVAAGASGAIARVNFYGQQVVETKCSGTTPIILYAESCFVRSVTAKAAGTGYSTTNPVTITIPAGVTLDTTTGTLTTTVPSTKNLIIEGYPPGHGKNTSTPRFSLKSITITNGGTGYTVAPEIKIASSSGFGAYATCAVTNGVITSVTVESGGGGYKTLPTVTAVSGGAEVFAVARPHLRGKYQCYYRYVDNTSAANGGPIPSNLSPVREVDAGEGAQSMTWTATGPSNTDGRSLTVELWRTTSNQALMLYRVGTGTSFVDDLTDEEVRDPDRAGYAAMPIVLPNGDLNAMRFSPPPNNKSVVVRYQDRFWYGVDTSGTEPNSLYFSEVDEPESVPDINEFVLQQNARDGDYVTALVPFGTSMLVMQSRHAYSLSFAKQPLLDANVNPIANRGCIGQRCWDIHSGVCYVLDQYGLYGISPQGDLKDLSAPIADIIRDRVDFSNVTWNFVLADAAKRVVRAFVAFKEDASGGYPTRALCYSIDTNAWWMERYPHRISGGVTAPLASGELKCMFSGQGGVYLLDEGHCDAARGAIHTVTVTNKGAGYRTPPKVTVTGGSGAELQAVLDSDGRVSGIWVVHPGYGYSSGTLTLSAPDDPDCAAPVQATATFLATTTASDTAISPSYRYRSGNYAFPTDANTKPGGSGQSRDISVTYKPQPSACDLAMRLYYNNSSHARPNAANRDRGAGFATRTVDGASRINMAALTAKTGADSGVAKAAFASRTIDDMRSADRHVAVELLGARRTSEPVIVYGLDVYGTANQQG
jgi:hypothetical protein